MRCEQCGRENPEGVKFCGECGTSLQGNAPCRRCGASNPLGVKFCHNCGESLNEAAEARTPAPQPAPALPGSFASGRYRVQRFLGEGAKKRVYLARDTKLESDVAIAVIKTEGLDGEGLIRIQREAQTMGRLRDHPHIVTVHDIGDEEGQPYIVQEVLKGGSLDDLLGEAEDHRLPLDQALRIAEQVCQALEYAHGQGIIHRDVKPGNIALTEEGTAKLGDFGLAVAVDRSRLTQEGMMVGTATYIPPEQAMGNEATPRSDLYSLGCVVYEMVCGRPPFVGDEAVAVITQHLNSTPVSPSWHRPDVPPGLETLVLRLLEKDRELRPASAADVRAALASIDLTAQPSAQAVAIGARPGPTGQNPIYRQIFVGRERELRQLQTAFDNALSGQPALIMVVGEPGIGKTTLCEQLATHATLRGGRTLVGHCYEEGSLSLPYLAFVEAMRSYVLDRDAEALREELGSGASEVARIVSEIRDRVQVELSPPGDPEEERYRLLQAVTAFLRNAATVQPLCIVLEDLHDADRGTLDLLTHLARNLQSARLVIVGTYRDVEVDRAHPLSSALAELRRVRTFSRVLLRGLSQDEVHRMLTSIANQEIPWRLAEAVYRQTEGNPLFIQEVLRYLVEEGLVTRAGGRWEQAGETAPYTAIPEGLRDVIGKRLSRLSADCNALLSVASVVGREFALETLRLVAALDEERLVAGLEEAVRVGVLEERSQIGDVRYRFAHAFFRQTLYQEMIAPRRIRLHQQVARALEEQYQGRIEEHAAELAEHFSSSSDDEDLKKAVHYGALAAQRAAAVYAHGEAVRLLEQTLQVQEVLRDGDDLRRHDLLMALAQSLLSAGEPLRVPETVAPQALEIAERLGDTERASEACMFALVGLAYYSAGTIFTSPEWAMWAEKLDGYAEPESASRVRADAMMSWTYAGRHQQRECWQLRSQALSLARRLEDQGALGNAVVAFLAGNEPPQLAAEQLRVAEDFAQLGHAIPRPGAKAQFLAVCAQALLGGGRREMAERLWQELDEYTVRIGDPYVRMWQMSAQVLRHYLDGELEQAVELAEQFGNQAAALGVEVVGQMISASAATGPLVDLGRFEEGLALQSRFEFLIGGDARYARLLALAGRREEARQEVRRIMAVRAIGPDEDWTDVGTLVQLLEASVMVDETDAAAVLSGRLAALDEWYIAVTGGTVARLRAQAAVLLGNAEEARAHLTTALEIAQRVRARGEIALVRLHLAELLLKHYPEERKEALAHLDFVIPEFRDMKMQPSLERALRHKMEAQGVVSGDVRTSIGAIATSLQAERPDVSMHASSDGRVTLLFTDIEDSVPITEALGDQRWLGLLRLHNGIVREQVRAHGGHEVKSQGDGFMIAFDGAHEALRCAVAIQRAVAGHHQLAAESIRVRIGLHTGEAVRDADDFYGRHVNLASRIADQARGGEILVSADLNELTDGGEFAFGEGRGVVLKGMTGTHRVFDVRW